MGLKNLPPVMSDKAFYLMFGDVFENVEDFIKSAKRLMKIKKYSFSEALKSEFEFESYLHQDFWRVGGVPTYTDDFLELADMYIFDNYINRHMKYKENIPILNPLFPRYQRKLDDFVSRKRV